MKCMIISKMMSMKKYEVFLYKGGRVLLYEIVKKYGFIIRYIISSLTIESLNVTDSYILNLFFIAAIISELLWLISFYSSKMVVYRKLGIDNSTVGSIGYTVSYIFYAVILFVVLLLFTKFKVIPINTNLDMKVFNYMTSYFTNIMLDYTNNILNNINLL